MALIHSLGRPLMSSEFDPAANRRRFLQYLAASPMMAAGGASAFAETILPKAMVPDPLMWGGIVALFNYMPYLGPIMASLLLALGGLMVFRDAWYSILPVATFVCCHLIESNLITPALVGRRLTINPLSMVVGG